MGRPEQASDAEGESSSGKRLRKPSDEQPSQQRRKFLSPLHAARSDEPVLGNAHPSPRSSDGPRASPGTHQEANADFAGLDESLMALLLPDGLAPASGSMGTPPEQAPAPAAVESDVPSSPVRAAPLTFQARAQEDTGELLPVAAAVAASGPPQVRVQNVIASGRVVVEGRRSASLDLRRIAVSCRLAEYNPRKINACIVRLRKPKCTGLIFRSGRVMVTGARSEDAALRAARLLVKMLQAVLAPPPPVVATAPERPALTGGVARQANDCSPGALDSAGSHTFGQTEHLAVTDAGTTASDQRAFEGLESQRLAGGDTVAERVESVVLARSESPTPSASSKGGSPSIRLTQFAVENIVATADCGLPVRLEGLAFDHKEFCSYEPELFAGLVYRYNPTPSLKAVLLIFVSGKVVITGCKAAAEIQEVFHSFFPVLLKYHT